MTKPTLKWILFDLDNTLLDFDQAASEALTKMFSRFSLTPIDKLQASYDEINHHCWHQFEEGHLTISQLKALRFERFVKANEIPHSPGILNTFYLEQLASHTVEIKGAKKLLDQAASRFKLALVTNGFAEVQRPRIHKSGLDQYFEHIVISEEIGANKPHSSFFDHTLQLLGQPNPDEVMIVGDSLSSDILGGNKAGIHTCWYNPKNIPSGHDIQPAFTVDNLHQIPHLWSA